MAWGLGSATRAMASINIALRLQADRDSDGAMGAPSLISRATCTYAPACAARTTVILRHTKVSPIPSSDCCTSTLLL